MSSISNIERWVAKGNSESDKFDRYISYFIAYNMLCSFVATLDDPKVNLLEGDSHRAYEVARIIDNPEEFVKSIQEELELYVRMIPVESEEEWGNPKKPKSLVPISKTLKEAIAKHDNRITIEYVLKWLYKVRCGMFHGEKEYDLDKWGPVLDRGNGLLLRLLLLLIERTKQRYGVS